MATNDAMDDYKSNCLFVDVVFDAVNVSIFFRGILDFVLSINNSLDFDDGVDLIIANLLKKIFRLFFGVVDDSVGHELLAGFTNLNIFGYIVCHSSRIACEPSTIVRGFCWVSRRAENVGFVDVDVIDTIPTSSLIILVLLI